MHTVSVIIPTFNAAGFIRQTLASVEAQTFSNFEVIVVDDGSTDETVQEVQQCAAGLDLRVICQSNAGPASARNRGILAATGRYCAFLDADDLMLPDRLATQVAMFESDPDLGLVHSDLMTFDDAGTIHRTRRAFSDPCGGMILDRLLIDNFITTSTVMARTDVLIQAGLFDEGRRLSEDFEMWLRIAAQRRIGYIERPLVRYRRRPGSLSDDKLRTGLAALEVVEAFWRSHPEYAQHNQGVFRSSMARHLAMAGSAAANQGKLLRSLGLLLRSVRFEPANADTWKKLLKAILSPVVGPSRTAHPPTKLRQGGSEKI